MNKTFKQTTYGAGYNMIDELIENETLPEELRDFTIDHFVTYDIEVVQKDINGEQLLSPISIAVGSTFADDMYFERKSSSPADGYSLVSEFMNYLEDLYRIYLTKLVKYNLMNISS